MSKKKKYIVEDSTVHGRGVFAAKDIKKGKKIIEYKGEIISWAEANIRYVELNGHSHTMFFGIDDETVIDGDDNGNEAKFINHSCKPNAEAKNKKGRIFIYAIKDIKKGKEIFYDYKLEFEGKITKKILKKYACFCGNSICRGTQLDLDSAKMK
jgi:uncharacterized protein